MPTRRESLKHQEAAIIQGLQLKHVPQVMALPRYHGRQPQQRGMLSQIRKLELKAEDSQTSPIQRTATSRLFEDPRTGQNETSPKVLHLG